MKIYNPSTGETIRDMPEDQPATLENKLTLLRSGQPAWARVALAERVRLVKAFATQLASNRDALAEVLSTEVGKPIAQSRNEINGAIARIEWLTDHAGQYLQPELMQEGPGMKERIVYEPLGVVCNISAWNYPYLVGVNVFVPALLAGNAVLYKPSEYASLTGERIAEMFYAAGIPTDVFQTAFGAAAVGNKLLQLPFDGYFFTGSYRTGLHIYQQVAPKMVPCQLELGGKDPLYVTDDIADVAAVAAATADGAFYNNGQSCCSVERIYVHEKVYDRYVEEFVKEVRSWKTGLPTEPGVYIGPLSREVQLGYIQDQVNDAVNKGAVIETGGKRIDRPGFFLEPTVLTGVDHRMELMKEESFGPVIGIMKVSGDQEAIRLMADTEYGLTASVYSAGYDRAEDILQKLDVGTGYWNCCDRVSAALPWSGRRHSGFGATLSHAGLRAFTKPKAYHLKG